MADDFLDQALGPAQQPDGNGAGTPPAPSPQASPSSSSPSNSSPDDFLNQALGPAQGSSNPSAQPTASASPAAPQPSTNSSVQIKPLANAEDLLKDNQPRGPVGSALHNVLNGLVSGGVKSLLGAQEAAASVGVGEAKAAFAAKDAVLGTPPQDQKSEFRKQVESAGTALADDSVLNSFSEGAAQFATGMLGTGAAAEVLGAGSLAAKAPWAFQTAKAAIAGSVFFDPHSGNMANVIQQVPGLANPVTGFLADNENDPAWMGRAKNALTSIGVDTLTQGMFLGGLRMVKALRSGDQEQIAAARTELQQAVQDNHENRSQQQQTAQGIVDAHGPIPSHVKQSLEGLGIDTSGAKSLHEVAERGPGNAAAVRDTLQQSGYDGVSYRPAPGQPRVTARFNNARGDETSQPTTSPTSPSQSTSSSSYSQPVPPSGATNSTGLAGETVNGPAASEGVQVPLEAAPQGASSPAFKPMFTDAQLEDLLNAQQADEQALEKYGTVENAIANGHTFSFGYKMPWQLLSQTGEPTSAIDTLLSRAAAMLSNKLDMTKGGSVITDKQQMALLNARARLWKEDPSALVGALHLQSKNAPVLLANMQAGFLLTEKLIGEAFAVSKKIGIGDLEDYGGSRDAAFSDFQQKMDLAMNLYGAANATSANMGRGLRGMRGEFAATAKRVMGMWDSVDPETMVGLMGSTNGNPAQAIPLIRPSLWSPGGLGYALKDAGQFMQFMMINNLISSPKTHAYIALANSFSLGVRPAERLIGGLYKVLTTRDAATSEVYSGVADKALRQYYYYMSFIPDAFKQAKMAFKIGDSIIAPHSQSIAQQGSGIGQAIIASQFRPMNSTGNFLHNALTAFQKTVAFPGRAVSFQDEFVRQIAYRSLVAAEARLKGVQGGLKDADLASSVQQAVTDAFDEYGHANNPELLNEANIMTAQQSLEVPIWGDGSGKLSWGETLRNARNAVPMAENIFPFVKTPVNLYRETNNLMPGLNLLRKQYYMQITGQMGPDQEAQAIGQMSLGLLMFSAAMGMAVAGHITPSGPPDPKIRSDVMRTGYRFNSFVINNTDGSHTYVPFDRVDPFAGTMSLAANLAWLEHVNDPATEDKREDLALAAAWAFIRSATDKLYLENFERLLEGISEGGNKFTAGFHQMVTNYIPGSILYNSVNPDPDMRDANSMVDSILRMTPGSSSLPPRRDAWGEPILAQRGFWQNDKGDIADAELQRLALSQKVDVGPPQSRVRGGVDLRDITMEDGSNAYEKYQELSRQLAPGMPTLRDQAADLINSDFYKMLPDGMPDVEGTKASMLMDLIHGQRSAALNMVRLDDNVSKAMTKRQTDAINALASKTVNPTKANAQSDWLHSMSRMFGIDLHAASGGSGADTPAPLPNGADLAH